MGTASRRTTSTAGGIDESTNARYLPLGINFAGVNCLVVGGGRIGSRKARALAEAGAVVSVISPTVADRLRDLIDAGQVTWQNERYSADHLAGRSFVVAATDDPALNLRIGRDAEARGILSCLVSPGRSSRAIFPAIHSDGEVTVAVHSNGRDCRASRDVRDEIADLLERRKRPPARFTVFGVQRSNLPGDVFRRLREVTSDDLDQNEAVLLSTCCRWEWYFTAPSPRPVIRDILAAVEERCGVLLDSHRPAFYTRCGSGARHHLLRVVCGLESPLLGESEIVGQARRALAEAPGSSDSATARAFQAAVSAQPDIRREAGFGSDGASWPRAVVSFLEQRLGTLSGKTVLLVGCGRMSRNIAARLLETGADVRPFSRRANTGVTWCQRMGLEVRDTRDLQTAKAIPHHAAILSSNPGSDGINRLSGALVVDLTGELPASVSMELYGLDDIGSVPLSGEQAEGAFRAGRLAFTSALRLHRRLGNAAVPDKIRIGARGSRLSRVQVGELSDYLRILLPDTELEYVPFESPGDRDKETPLPSVIGDDFFTRDLDRALARGDVDLAVHSAKDLPDRLPDGIGVAAVTPAFAPWECLVSRDGAAMPDLPAGARVGTSSDRRRETLLALRPDAVSCDIRGNVPDRVRQLDAGQYDALLLAAVGLIRLGMTDRITQIFPLDQFPPAPGQSSLALAVREDDPDLPGLLAPLDLGERKGLPWA